MRVKPVGPQLPGCRPGRRRRRCPTRCRSAGRIRCSRRARSRSCCSASRRCTDGSTRARAATIATHHPPAASVVRPSTHARRRPGVARLRRAGEQVDEPERGQHQERLQLLGEEAESRRARRYATIQRTRPSSSARVIVYAARDEQQHEQRVRVVEAEHERGDGREREHGARDQRGGRREPALDGREQDADRGDALERLRHEDAPRVHAEDARRDLHDPQRRRASCRP